MSHGQADQEVREGVVEGDETGMVQDGCWMVWSTTTDEHDHDDEDNDAIGDDDDNGDANGDDDGDAIGPATPPSPLLAQPGPLVRSGG